MANADVLTLNRAQRQPRARHIMKQQQQIIAPSTTAGKNACGKNEKKDHEESLQPVNPLLQHLSRKERQKAAKAAKNKE